MVSHAGAGAATPDEAFLALYRARYGQMVRLATLMVDEVGLAEEVAQDAFVAVYLRWDAVDDRLAYLRSCVVNGGRDIQRRRRVQRDRAHLLAASVPASEPDHMRDALRQLPPNERAALVLRFYEDLTVPQIAEVMGARQGTVKSWLHRALAELREVVERGS